jgi:two-component system nitrogen regulation sensor histidine kinase NtrY
LNLRNRLVVAFLIATILPLAATIWISSSLIERSLAYATTSELDRLSRTLEATARQFYQRERDILRQDAAAGHVTPTLHAMADQSGWPDAVRTFWESAEAERFSLSGVGGSHLDLMRRTARGVEVFSRDLGGMHMEELSTQFRKTRELVGSIQSRDLRRGFTLTLLLLIAVVWIVSLAPLIFIAHRISRPIQALTAGLDEFAKGDWNRRLTQGRDDEVGRAVEAFNRMADELGRNRDRLVYLTQMTSWQTLARKTAHELKNSLTPIRLTVEEMLARQPASDREFLEEATRIVVSEIETLERRVRAFSEFASEPTADPEVLDVNALVTERVALLRPAHPETAYQLNLDAHGAHAYAGPDLVKGILTNLLENAAEAAGRGGAVMVVTSNESDHIRIDVHDSGPGLSKEASGTLFEPTITFKKHGMGLGLSIARKNALLLGGDITLVPGQLGGAGFRVTLPTR